MKELARCTVLLVDDTRENLDVLVGAMAGAYDIVVAMDGQTALDISRKSPPDLILLDIMMPGLDGYEVCRRLKESPATRDIPVIFLLRPHRDHQQVHGVPARGGGLYHQAL